MPEMTEDGLRAAIVATCRAMNAAGINQGMSGNVSARWDTGFLITPSGVAYERMTPDMIVPVAMSGAPLGAGRPSSEWRMHRDLYATRPGTGAVVHAHPPHATALACLRRPIPAFHYMVAMAGGTDIRCADYAGFGTEALSANMLAAMAGRQACLLANHGMICTGADLEAAFALAVEVEALARHYAIACGIGTPVILGAAEMAEVIARFADYRQGAARGADGSREGADS